MNIQLHKNARPTPAIR